ncbi:MAG: hypothetical protein JSS55_12050 [Proteobacteria bacterium]|nr:hypothetical protein [Pseudomonadota bacterium]
MTRIVFQDRDGRPLAGAVVAITTAPAEMNDIGYVTGDDGAIALTIPLPGSYGFTLTGADGGRLIASKQLQPEGDATVTAHAMG